MQCILKAAQNTKFKFKLKEELSKLSLLFKLNISDDEVVQLSSLEIFILCLYEVTPKVVRNVPSTSDFILVPFANH